MRTTKRNKRDRVKADSDFSVTMNDSSRSKNFAVALKKKKYKHHWYDITLPFNWKKYIKFEVEKDKFHKVTRNV